MYSPNYVFVFCLVIFTAHSVQPWGGLGVIANAQIQFFKEDTVENTVPVQQEQNEVEPTYESVEQHEYITEEPTNPITTERYEWVPIQVRFKDEFNKSHTLTYFGKKKYTRNKVIEYEHNNMIVTYDPVENYEYISAKPKEHGNIFRIKYSGNPRQPTVELVVADEHKRVMGLAYNKYTNILYWTSGNAIKYAQISSPTFTVPSNGTVLLELDDSSPSDVQIDACRGYLYFINWLNSGPVTIEQMRLDGSERKVLFYFNKMVLLGLTLDKAKNRLYWSLMDPSKKEYQFSVECSELDNGSRKTVIKEVNHMPRGFALDDEKVLWFDARSKSLWSAPTDGSESPTNVLKYEDYKNLPIRIIPGSSCSHECGAAYPLQEDEIKPENVVLEEDLVFKPFSSQTFKLITRPLVQYPSETVDVKADDESADGIRLG